MTKATAEVNFKAEVTYYSVSFGSRETLGSTFGPQTPKMADGDSEEVAIRDYLKKKDFTYDGILALLDKYHGVRMSIATLKRRLKEYGLKRRNVDYDMVSVRDKIRGLLDGPDCMGGYRHIWHTLKMQGIGVPRSVVEASLRELDPEGTEKRRAHRFRRRPFYEGGTGTMGQMTHGTAMGMTSSNFSAFQFTPASMDGAEKYYDCNTIKQLAA